MLIPITDESRTDEAAEAPRNLIQLDGQIWDADTGEWIGYAIKDEFRVNDVQSAEWVLSKILRAETEIAAIQTERAAILANLESREKEYRRKVDYLRARFGPELEEFARAEIEANPKSKTLKLAHGKLSFRTVKGGVRVKDATLALDWAKEHCPDAVKVVESFQISMVAADAKARIAETIALGEGEYAALVADAFEVKPDAEAFDIKTGVGA